MHKYLFYKILTENGEKFRFKIWRNPLFVTTQTRRRAHLFSIHIPKRWRVCPSATSPPVENYGFPISPLVSDQWPFSGQDRRRDLRTRGRFDVVRAPGSSTTRHDAECCTGGNQSVSRSSGFRCCASSRCASGRGSFGQAGRTGTNGLLLCDNSVRKREIKQCATCLASNMTAKYIIVFVWKHLVNKVKHVPESVAGGKREWSQAIVVGNVLPAVKSSSKLIFAAIGPKMWVSWVFLGETDYFLNVELLPKVTALTGSALFSSRYLKDPFEQFHAARWSAVLP